MESKSHRALGECSVGSSITTLGAQLLRGVAREQRHRVVRLSDTVGAEECLQLSVIPASLSALLGLERGNDRPQSF